MRPGASSYKDPDSLKIGECIADQIPDAATLQLGIGNLPNAVALHLKDHNDLGIRSELFSLAFARLVKSGVANGVKRKPCIHASTYSLFRSATMNDFINDNPSMESYASSYVNDIHIIKPHDYMMSVKPPSK